MFIAFFATSAFPADVAYEGKYKKSAWCREFIRDLPKLRDAALKSNKEKLGLVPKEGKQIEFELKDVRDELPGSLEKYEGSAFVVNTNEKGAEVVTIYMEFLSSGRVDTQKLVTHETTHAIMRTHLGGDAYANIPGWLREGLAVWAADEIEQKSRVLIRRTARDKKFDEMIVGLGTAEREDQHYAEFGLAIERIAKNFGDEKVRELAMQITEGADAKETLAKVTGESWEDFVTASRTYAMDRIQAMKPPEFDAYRTVAEADLSKPASAVERYCRDFLRDHSGSWCKPNVLYFRGKAARQDDNYALSERSLQSALRKDAADLDFVDDALFQLASNYIDAGSANKADDPARELLRDHPTSPHQARALYFLIEAEAAKGDVREAKRLIRIYERSFPKGDDRDKIRSLSRRL